MIYTTQAELEAAVAEWQRILRLQDWDIKCLIASVHDMGGGWASISPNWQYKTARLKVISAEGAAIGEWPNDHEESVVHELLHLHTIPIYRKEGEEYEFNEREELAINLISEALVKMRRLGNSPSKSNAPALSVKTPS